MIQTGHPFPTPFGRSTPIRLVVVVLILLGAGSCVHRVVRKTYTPDSIATLDNKSAYLKIHFRNGDVAIVNKWSVNESTRVINGSGCRLSPARDTLQSGDLTIPVDSVALFETNVVKTSPTIVSMSILTGVSAALTILCISSPKTCFGSCPTFYWGDGTDSTLVAEGFSSSVAPSLEKTDIDALWNVRPEDGSIRLHLTNEALETHVIREAVVLAVKQPEYGRIIKGRDGRMFQSPRQWEPISCTDDAGSCLELVTSFDHNERYSPADSANLAAKETIECAFVRPAAEQFGLLIASRQTLLSTYLFYQSLAYMGTRASDFLCKLEQGNEFAKKAAVGPGRLLGEIVVQMQDATGNWVAADSTMETGPLATDFTFVPLPDATGDTIRLRIVLNKGHWRLDYLALAEIGHEAAPIMIEPSLVKSHGSIDDSAKLKLSSDSDFLITLPGDAYDIYYSLPDSITFGYEYFLQSRGYYLEWMRQEWNAEEDMSKLAQMLMNPGEYLKTAAPEYKRTEATMEGYFWGSRFAR